MGMVYGMEELLPVVKRLSEKYTGMESTSVTYETAQRLMEAVIYCLDELENSGGGGESGGWRADGSDGQDNTALRADSRMDAMEAYEAGYRLVLDRTWKAKKLYEEILGEFQDYDNLVYHDTVIKGMPEFFVRYDPLFAPQDHLLTLDYPVLRSLERLSGIDRIWEYLTCIRLEQSLLCGLPHEYVWEALRYYHRGYRGLCFNISATVLRNVLAHVMTNGKITRPDFSLEQWASLEGAVRGKSAQQTEEELRTLLSHLLDAGFPGQQEMYAYFQRDMRDFAFELSNAEEHGCLPHAFSVS